MQEINDIMKSIIDKTDILLQGNIVSRETLIKNSPVKVYLFYR